MKNAVPLFDGLAASLRRFAMSNAAPMDGRKKAELSDRLVQAIRRKCHIVHQHTSFLSAITWDHVERAGTRDLAADERSPNPLHKLRVNYGGTLVECSDREEALNLVYSAFDGVVAGCVNTTDTMARLINLVYELGIPERKANLVPVANLIPKTCPLGVILDNPASWDWHQAARELRGECQHADIQVLLSPSGAPFGRGFEPVVPERYSFGLGEDDRRVSRYSVVLVEKVERLLIDISQLLISSPQNAIGQAISGSATP